MKYFVMILLAVAFLLGMQCVKLIDQRNELMIARYAPMMEVISDGTR